MSTKCLLVKKNQMFSFNEKKYFWSQKYVKKVCMTELLLKFMPKQI